MDESDSDRSQRLFRKVALARLSSPDRLDVLLGISRPQTILAWIGAAILLAALLFWGFTWPVEQKVVGRCILTSPSGIAEVTAGAAGVVGGLGVKLGDRVVANQVIGRIIRAELDDQIRHARDRLAELERRRDEITRLNHRASSQGRSSASAERGLFEAQVRLAEGKAAAIEKRLVTERELVAQGLITRRTLLDSEEAHAAAILEREQLVDRAAQSKLGYSEQERQRERERIAIDFQVNETRRSLEASLDIERQSAPIISIFSGRVVEIKIGNGVAVGFGSPILLLERVENSQGDVEAAIYFPGGEGKLVAMNMDAEVVPDYVKRQEFGFLRARIESVSDYPVSSPGMRLLVQNDNLVRELSESRSAIFARARLERNDKGGFAWSAAAAESPEVRPGALCRAEVTVRERPPFARLIAMVKQWTRLH
ncbi:MAG: NHLP bacteriocin system secretion protein [Rhodocyclales bacterium]|nr:NHLP bacteriocin system secretion protein [Rhodocyclales bacterium]